MKIGQTIYILTVAGALLLAGCATMHGPDLGATHPANPQSQQSSYPAVQLGFLGTNAVLEQVSDAKHEHEHEQGHQHNHSQHNTLEKK
jgi:hypothetical protein